MKTMSSSLNLYQKFNKIEKYQYMNLERKYAFIETRNSKNILLCEYLGENKFTISFYPYPKATRTILSKRDIK